MGNTSPQRKQVVTNTVKKPLSGRIVHEVSEVVRSTGFSRNLSFRLKAGLQTACSDTDDGNDVDMRSVGSNRPTV